jgi:hypothetical protein
MPPFTVIYRGELKTSFTLQYAENVVDAAEQVLDQIIGGQAHHRDKIYVVPTEAMHVFTVDAPTRGLL